MARVYPARHIPAANNMANTRFTRNTDRYHKNLYPGLSIFHLFLDLLYNGNPKMSCKWDQRQYRKEKYPNYQLVGPWKAYICKPRHCCQDWNDQICFSVHIFLSLMAGSLKVTMIHLSSGNKYQNHPACTSMTEIIQLKIWYQQGNMLSGNTQTCLFIIFFLIDAFTEHHIPLYP